MNGVEWFIARRYLFSRERKALEWFVTIISVLGVAVGVGTMISVNGVMDGMRAKVVKQIVAFTPHLKISNNAWQESDPPAELLERLRARPEVEAAEPVVFIGAGLRIGEGANRIDSYARVYGVDRIEPGNVFQATVGKEKQNFDLKPGQIVVSESLTTRSLVGESVLARSEASAQTALFRVPKAMRFEAAGTFHTGNDWFDEHNAFVSRSDVRELALRKGGINYVHVKLHRPLQADTVKEDIRGMLPEGSQVVSWDQDFGEMFSDMRVMQTGMQLVLLMTILVAALNIIGTLVLIVIQKTREIGILKAMGASGRLVGRIFLLEGTLVGTVGSLLGVGLGLAFCALVKFVRIPVPLKGLGFKTLPAEFDPLMILIIFIASVMICTIAAFAPAHRAARLDPVEALQHE